jgi:DNA repair photolyase
MITPTLTQNRLPYTKGRGPQYQGNSPFSQLQDESILSDNRLEDLLKMVPTQVIFTTAGTAVNKVDSSDLGFSYSLNPYQGCEHGCVYCYARSTHEYWGYNSGLDFEQKILVKRNLIAAFEKQISQKSWKAKPILLSCNTDCYQPIEREMELTRKVLQTCLKYRHPVAIITKNALVKRDIDILKALAEHSLVHVMISLTGQDEHLRRALEPRTSTYMQRIETIQFLAQNHIPVGVMVAPIIPGLNSQQIPEMLLSAGRAGAGSAGMAMVRLNGAVEPLFKDWLQKTYPDKKDKVWNQICETHGGKANDSRPGVRLRGEGPLAESIRRLFKLSAEKFIKPKNFEFNCDDFNHKAGKAQLSLF